VKEQYTAHKEHLQLAKMFSSVRLIGPPMNKSLVEMVVNLFSADEAKVIANVPFYYPGSLKRISRKALMPESQAKVLLDNASNRKVILRVGNRYALLPILPGIFEYTLMSGDDSGWRKEYSKQIVAMFSTGYIKKYLSVKMPGIRTIPVESTVEPKHHVADADLISKLLDHHTVFAVAHVCQCRQSVRFAGRECNRASVDDGCLVFGSFAAGMERSGLGRLVSKEEMASIIDERWQKKLVFLTANVSVESPNAICTCCDCCCHGLETINHFDGMKIMSQPHFIASVDESLCNHCGKCLKTCNTAAHFLTNKKHGYDSEKCIGCGLCIEHCKVKAIAMVENKTYRPPAKSFGALGKKLLPKIAIAGVFAKISEFRKK